MKRYIAYGLVAFIIILMLVVLAINMSRGTPLTFNTVEVDDEAVLTVTCQQHHADVISTAYLWDDFLDDCNLASDLSFDAAFFQEQVIVLYLYDGDSAYAPKAFYDYLFSQDNYEIINVRYHWSLRSDNQDERTFYLIYIDKDDIIGGNVLFD